MLCLYMRYPYSSERLIISSNTLVGFRTQPVSNYNKDISHFTLLVFSLYQCNFVSDIKIYVS